MKTKLLSTLLTAISTACILPSVSFAQFTTLWTQTNNIDTWDDAAFGITADASGIYVAGNETDSLGDSKWHIEKRNLSTGIPIWTQISNPSSLYDAAHAITADASGIYIVGSEGVTSGYRWRIEKRDLNTGNLIWSQSTSDTNSLYYSFAFGITADASGIYIVCTDDSLNQSFNSNCRWRIEKRNLNTGNLIWTQIYSNMTSFGSEYSLATAITADASGIYVVGLDIDTSVTMSNKMQWRTEKRNLSTGALIWTQISDTSTSHWAQSVTADASGIYVAGNGPDTVGGIGSLWRIEKRDLSTGTLIWAQTNKVFNWTAFYIDEILATAVDANGVYVVGHENDILNPTGLQWRTEKRDLYTGALICIHTSNPSDSIDMAFDITADGSGIYVAGSANDSLNPYYSQWRIEKYNGVCLPTTIESLENKKEILIYPNPFSTQTTFQTDNSLHNATLTMYNCFGQTVAQIKNISEQAITFNRDNLSSGLYFVRLTQDGNTISADKFVIVDK